MALAHLRAAPALLTALRLLQRAARVGVLPSVSADGAVSAGLAAALSAAAQLTLDRALPAAAVAAACGVPGPSAAVLAAAAARCLAVSRAEALAEVELHTSRAAMRLVEHPSAGPTFEPLSAARRAPRSRPLSAPLMASPEELAEARRLEAAVAAIDATMCVAVAAAAGLARALPL